MANNSRMHHGQSKTSSTDNEYNRPSSNKITVVCFYTNAPPPIKPKIMSIISIPKPSSFSVPNPPQSPTQANFISHYCLIHFLIIFTTHSDLIAHALYYIMSQPESHNEREYIVEEDDDHTEEVFSRQFKV